MTPQPPQRRPGAELPDGPVRLEQGPSRPLTVLDYTFHIAGFHQNDLIFVVPPELQGQVEDVLAARWPAPVTDRTARQAAVMWLSWQPWYRDRAANDRGDYSRDNWPPGGSHAGQLDGN